MPLFDRLKQSGLDFYSDFKHGLQDQLKNKYNLYDTVYDLKQFPQGSNPDLALTTVLREEGNLRHAPTMGTIINFDPNKKNPFNEYISPFAFSGPGEFESVKELKQTNQVLRDHLKNISTDDPSNPWYAMDPERKLKEQQFIADKIQSNNNAIDQIQHPFYRNFLKYQIGNQLDKMHIGGTVYQSPVGGKGGARDKLYGRLTNKALALPEKPAPGMPADVGEATRKDLGRWKNAEGKIVDFYPANLKQPAIRQAYGLPQSYDVSDIARNHNNLVKPVIQGNPYNATSRSVSTQSPRFRASRAALAGDTMSVLSALPSAEAIKAYGEQGFIPGIRQQAFDYAQGIPSMAVAGGLGYVAPMTTTTLLPGVAAGMGLAEGARSINELTRQTTGESLLSKTRQFLGTEPRTGYIERPLAGRFSKDLEQINNPPTMQPNTNPRSLAKQKRPFNPLRLEFGISERLFGPNGRFKPFKGLGILR